MEHEEAKHLIQEALLRLLVDRDISLVTVSDIAREAGINRKSYYYHYYDKSEVLDDVIDGLLAPFETLYEAGGRMRGITGESLGIYRERQDEFFAIMSGTAATRLRDEMWSRFVRFYAERTRHIAPAGCDPDFIARCRFHALYDVIELWVLEGCVRGDEEIIATVRAALRKQGLRHDIVEYGCRGLHWVNHKRSPHEPHDCAGWDAVLLPHHRRLARRCRAGNALVVGAPSR